MDSLLLLSVSPTSGVPVYRQLMDQLRALIATGQVKAGELLPSVRRVAQQLQINPMTVSKAYSLLERSGVIELVRGHGMRVNAPKGGEGSVKRRQEAILPLLEQVASSAYQLALTREQVLAMLSPLLKESDHD